MQMALYLVTLYSNVRLAYALYHTPIRSKDYQAQPQNWQEGARME